MTIHALINARAGSLIGANLQEFSENIEHALQADGAAARVKLVEPGDLEMALDDAISDGAKILAVGGGDGTIKAAGARIAGTDAALGVIPLGTINLLARDLKLPFDPVEAAAVIARGKQKTIDVASVNEDVFLCSSLLGFPIYIAEQRQALRGKPFADRLGGYGTIIKTFLRNRRRFSIEIDGGGAVRKARALSIAISNNPLAERAAAVPQRATLDSGKLAIYLSKHRNGLAMGKSILFRMLGLNVKDREIEEFTADEITLRSRRKTVRLSNDGEIEHFGTPLHYRILKQHLRVIIP